MIEVNVKVNDKIGFHARTSSLFAREAQKFKSRIIVGYGERVADARSMLSLMALGVKQGEEVQIGAEGRDCEQAVAALKTLVENGFEAGQ